jgi:putative ABC transport system permease protein
VPRAFFDQRGGHAGFSNSARLVLEKKDGGSLAAVRSALDRSLGQEGVKALGSATKSDGRYSFDQHMLMIYVFLIVMSAILVGVGGLGLVTTMSLNVLERRREMGVMRAIGATPGLVCRIMAAEGCVIGLMSWAASGMIAWPVSRVMGNVLVNRMFTNGLDFAFETSGLWIWLAVCLVLGVFASVLPAWQASRRPVREAIGYE